MDILDKEDFEYYVPYSEILDLDSKKNRLRNVTRVFIFRLIFQMFFVHFLYHPDEFWQSIEIAYDLLYGVKSGSTPQTEAILSWEWSNHYALRNHLYPFYLSIPGQILKYLPLGSWSNIVVVNSMYMMHTVLVTFGDYFFFKLAKDIAGRECAVVTTIFSLTHEYALRYHTRTCANSVETSLCIIALYYYNKLWKPEVFDGNLTKMTLAISISFLIRSSSLAGWLPLAVLKIAEFPRGNLSAIIVAGVTVAIPCVLMSFIIDSYYYGVWTFPQYNFVYYNVVENLSVHFGIDPWYAYIHGFRDQYGKFVDLAIFGLAWISVKQISEAREGKSGVPSVLVFTVSSLAVLSTVDHKELRFLSPLVQLGCMSEAFVIVQGYRVKSLRLVTKWAVITIMFMGAAVGYIYATRAYQGIFYSSAEPHLLFRSVGNKVTEQPESVFVDDKFAVPIHSMLHSDSAEGQTTSLYKPFRQPLFVNKKTPPPSSEVQTPLVTAPWYDNENTNYVFIELLWQLRSEQPVPEYIVSHYLGPMAELKS